MVNINKFGDDFLRKKQLLQTLKSYIEKNAELEKEIFAEKQNAMEAKAELNELAARAERAEKALADLEERMNAFIASAGQPVANEQLDAEEPELSDEAEEYVAPEQPKVETVKREPLKTEDGYIDVSAFGSIQVNREMQYASEAIGEIVIKCATVSNEFAKHGGPTCRELINLALGRTEVFKADCLTIASSNTSYSVKKECIDRIKADTEDYFESLKAQLD